MNCHSIAFVIVVIIVRCVFLMSLVVVVTCYNCCY